VKSRSLPAAAVAALVLVLGVADRARAGDAPTKYYRDATHKFSLKYFDKWDQIPVEAGEKVEVAKFAEKGDRGDVYAPKINVVRVEKGDRAKPVITGGDEVKPDGAPDIDFPGMKPESAFEALVGRFAIPDKHKPSADKFKKVKSADDVEGRLYQFDVPFDIYVGRPPEVISFTIATFEQKDVEYGILCICSKARSKGFKTGFEQVAKSFRFKDDKAKDVESLAVLDGVNISAERRRQIERTQIKGWNVIVSPKKQYVVIYDTKNGKNNALAKVIAERIEKIREQVYEVQFPPAQPITAVSIVRVCRDKPQYHQYGGPGGSAGYWSSGTEELVFYDASPSKKIDDDTVAVLYHEAFHQFIYYSVGEVAPHSWFNEGHGDYYAGARYKNGKFKIEPFAWRTGVVKGAIVQGPRPYTKEKDKNGEEKETWGDKGYTPLQSLVKFTQREYYSYPSVSYAQGWSLVYFLREIVPKNKAWNAKWGKILPTYFDTLKAEVAKRQALKPGGEKPEGEGGDEPAPGGEGDPAPGGPEGEPAPGDPPPGEPAPGEPAPGEAAPGEPAPGEPAPGEPAPGEPAPGGDTPAEPTEPPPEGFMAPENMPLSPQEALEKAVQTAFEGIDWEEFEKAWKESIKGVSG
jgi:hypothetical protein